MNSVVDEQLEYSEGLNFAVKPWEHMQESGRFVPVQILMDVIEVGEALPDPQGDPNSTMYYTRMTKNGNLYNLEVLYNSSKNSIYHFLYTDDPRGPLPKITKNEGGDESD